MNPDDKICYCYGVSLRKLVNFAKRTQPERPSRMSECLGAGTGCGWCIPYLIRIAEAPERFEVNDSADDYAEGRRRYINEKQPPNQFSKGEGESCGVDESDGG
jgi:bacterioferritin-associated ferredoxin